MTATDLHEDGFMDKDTQKKFSVDRTVMTATRLEQSDEDRYWQLKSPAERIEAIEINRRIVYGYTNPPRLQRVLEIARR